MLLITDLVVHHNAFPSSVTFDTTKVLSSFFTATKGE
jgi:hypothetical protein